MSEKISIDEFHTLLKEQSENVAFIDVRTPAEYRSAHIEGVVNIPLNTLEKHIAELSKKEKVYVHCKSGARTEQACKLLDQYHLSNVYHMDGGMDNWAHAGYAVMKGKSVLPLMRQVQIAAGGLTMLGVVLGFTHHDNWFYLSGFVGAGLLYAGVSGTCGMATILSKMPWNR